MIEGLKRANERGVQLAGGNFWGKLDCWIYCEGGRTIAKTYGSDIGRG